MTETRECKAKVTEIFGSHVFGDDVMRERLPKPIYKSLHKTIEEGAPLEKPVAEVVASAMKDWAIEKGATHFTHWFQPMTGITAEKHDAFISPTHDGKVIMEFSGKELIKGEPDASSFPSGGLRATFEARGYTAWDATSYAFVKDGTLYIPTAFCSYSGEALDKKTPLLRSMEAVDIQAKRILKLFGQEPTRVITTVGPEQEYFLVDMDLYKKRRDLVFTGRTLFGAKPPKGQELEDHYFGAIKERVANYMKEVDETLWKLGVSAKTKHNEVAPAQHELASIFNTSNIATDHNQLTMEVMKKVAAHHGLACLLHEKPFAGVNGSGKHNNWSLSTSDGDNLLEPGKSPEKNARFLLFLVAVIKAVDDYADLLRLSVATAGNDHRLGANEAPPAIISVFLGDQLDAVLESIVTEKAINFEKMNLDVGVPTLPGIRKDTTDRNRTSPFAFTGNKFEFRMPGSSLSASGPNIVLNTIVAETLSLFADRLEKAADFDTELEALIKEMAVAHKRIVFNGNNYSQEWLEIAAKRGLPNLLTTADALPCFIADKNVKMFEKHCVFTATEVHSRYEILLEGYNKTLGIEALTMLDMAKRDILPAVLAYQKELTAILVNKKELGSSIESYAENELLTRISKLTSCLWNKIEALDKTVLGQKDTADELKLAQYIRDTLIPAMNELRAVGDELETMMPAEYWPYPVYGDLLFQV